jgi:hypothetical protein
VTSITARFLGYNLLLWENQKNKTVSPRLFWISGGLVILMILGFLGLSDHGPAIQKQAITTPLITGFGATHDDWNRSHIADTRFTPNSAYNPDPTLSDPRYNDRYIVTSRMGRVLSYEMRLSGNPDIGAAKAAALKEFPSDASLVWFSQKSACFQMELKSAILGAALSDPSNSNGATLVEFQTRTQDGKDTYSPTDNNDIFFNLGVYQNAQDAPAC